MSTNSDVINAPTVLVGLPDVACFTSFKDFLEALPKYLYAQIPTSVTNVVIGNTQPNDSQRNSLWFRKDNSGSFVGLYIYSAGIWNQIYPVPNQLFRVYRLTTDPLTYPKGFDRADNSPNIAATTKTWLITQWLADPGNPGYYLVYDLVYIGF